MTTIRILVVVLFMASTAMADSFVSLTVFVPQTATSITISCITGGHCDPGFTQAARNNIDFRGELNGVSFVSDVDGTAPGAGVFSWVFDDESQGFFSGVVNRNPSAATVTISFAQNDFVYHSTLDPVPLVGTISADARPASNGLTITAQVWGDGGNGITSGSGTGTATATPCVIPQGDRNVFCGSPLPPSSFFTRTDGVSLFGLNGIGQVDLSPGDRVDASIIAMVRPVTPVPEPSSIVLVGIGGLVFALSRARGKKNDRNNG